ncbi:hypothetical protein V1282_005778 [Nitrobacteraceae bacterium AZCC 2146]
MTGFAIARFRKATLVVLSAMGTAGLLVGGVAASYWAMRNAPAMGGTTAGT